MTKALTAAAEHGIAADRFAREIVRFLKTLPARSRQLNANPLAGLQRLDNPTLCNPAELIDASASTTYTHTSPL